MNTPECLKRKLVFGDREQIEAIRAIEFSLEQKAKMNDPVGELKQYSISVEYCGEYTETVWAKSEEDAKEQAEDIGMDAIDFDRSVYVRRIVK